MISREFINDWVPNSMKVVNTIMMCVRDFLEITTFITFWVIMVDQSHSMEGLVNISNIMYNKSEGKWLLVIFIFEIFLDNFDILSVFRWTVTFEEFDQGIESHINLLRRWFEVWEVFFGSTLIKVWLVDEMPAWLPSHALTLDFICKSCTFSERMVFLWFDQWWVLFTLRKRLENIEGFLKSSRSVLF